MVSAQSPQQEGKLTNKGKQAAAKDQRGTEKAPLIVKTLAPQKSEEETKREEEDRKHKAEMDRRTLELSESQTLANIFLAFISTLAAGFAGWAARAASRSAEANSRVVKAMEETAVRQLRAYVWARPDAEPKHKITNSFDLSKYGISFRIENNGQTPAYDVWHTISLASFDRETEVPEAAIPNEGSNFVLNPGSHSLLRAKPDNPIPQSEWITLQGGERGLYVYGVIRYEDAFENVRTTRFRMRFYGDYLAWCQTGNTAD